MQLKRSRRAGVGQHGGINEGGVLDPVRRDENLVPSKREEERAREHNDGDQRGRREVPSLAENAAGGGGQDYVHDNVGEENEGAVLELGNVGRVDAKLVRADRVGSSDGPPPEESDCTGGRHRRRETRCAKRLIGKDDLM